MKHCSLCGSAAIPNTIEPNRVNCSRPGCDNSQEGNKYGFSESVWEHRPIEDKLLARVEKLEEEIKTLRAVTNCLKRREEYQNDAIWFADLHYYMKKVWEFDADNKEIE